MILPFVVFMIRDFGFSEDVVGVYAGLLTATFALCQFLSSYFWGAISDKYGRRAALLTGSLFSAAALILFGTSLGYGQAVAARSVAGIFNGNIGVARAYVADVTNGLNRAFAFSIFAVAFSAGIVVGSACGGSLIRTFDLEADGRHRQSQGLLEWWVFDDEFPYLLPCVIGAAISLFSFAMTFVFIQETDNLAKVHLSKNLSVLTSCSPQRVTPSTTASTSATPNLSKMYDEVSASKSRSLPMVSMGGVAAASSSKVRTKYSKDDQHLLLKAPSHSLFLEASLVATNAMGTNAMFDALQSLRSKAHGERGALLEADSFDATLCLR